MLTIIVIILIIAVLGLIIYNLGIHKKIQTYKNINQKINNLSVVQDFMSAIGETSTVDEKHWNSLKSLQDVDMFKDSIAQATPKYVTVNNDHEKLPYQQMEFGRAKSAIFFPLYIDNVYIGYWII